MNQLEVNVVLTRAAMIDGRLSWSTDEARAETAVAWSAVLKDVALSDALAAVLRHYESEVRVIMPADIRALAGGSRARLSSDQVNREVWLRQRGLTEQQWEELPRSEKERLVNGGEIEL